MLKHPNHELRLSCFVSCCIRKCWYTWHEQKMGFGINKEHLNFQPGKLCSIPLPCEVKHAPNIHNKLVVKYIRTSYFGLASLFSLLPVLKLSFSPFLLRLPNQKGWSALTDKLLLIYLFFFFSFSFVFCLCVLEISKPFPKPDLSY